MLFSAIVNTARPERCLLLSSEEAARLTLDGWQAGDTVRLTEGPWTFVPGDRVTTADIPEERLWASIIQTATPSR